jgi:hypothetical protein
MNTPDPIFTLYPPTIWEIKTSPFWNKGFATHSLVKGFVSDRGYFPEEVMRATRWLRFFHGGIYVQIWVARPDRNDRAPECIFNWPAYKLDTGNRIVLPSCEGWMRRA